MTLSTYSPLAFSFTAVSAALEILRIYFDIFEMLVMMKVLGAMMVRVTEMLVMTKVLGMLMVRMVVKLMMCRAGSLSPWGGQLKVVRFLCLLGVDGGGELSISA